MAAQSGRVAGRRRSQTGRVGGWRRLCNRVGGWQWLTKRSVEKKFYSGGCLSEGKCWRLGHRGRLFFVPGTICAPSSNSFCRSTVRWASKFYRDTVQHYC
jgi:hypothetical protein